MILSLKPVCSRGLLFQPARNHRGELVGLEIITSCREPEAQIDDIALFQARLALLEQCAIFFIRRQLTAWIPVTPAVANALVSDPALMASARRFPFLALTIAEDFGDVALLGQLKNHFSLVLANLGAGDSIAALLFSGLFSAAMFDADFIRRQLPRASFEPFMRALMAQIAPAVEAVMVSGVDNAQMLARLTDWEFHAMRGALWPAVGIEALTRLVQE